MACCPAGTCNGNVAASLKVLPLSGRRRLDCLELFAGCESVTRGFLQAGLDAAPLDFARDARDARCSVKHTAGACKGEAPYIDCL